ncbi:flagellar biosynthesis anti-sigma factor FlgM [Paraburkholderia phosphatilytica]|uniref:flagellar biosynthesis anti-sigma factor FlgM n=1 Tax=Paraburkholderia phosphatilytica TaxID=2282883 RepID=UPI000E4E9FEE|nr:flagellar biosynthesis anti-sigma factor FlgM [Paraburkholderia phosphatilytica]
MKIDSSTNPNVLQYQDNQTRTQQNATGSTGTSGSATTPAAGTTVNLSGLSSHVRSAAASNSGDIDTAKVESVKAALRNGTYQVDSGKIADGMLQSARDTMKPSAG